MNWNTMFKSKKDNPFYTKLKEINSRQRFVNKIEKAFYLGGFVYTEEGYGELQKAISENRLSLFVKEVSYNTKKDNIELYLVEDELVRSKIIVVLDTLELYNKEEVLKVIPCINTLLDEIEAQQVYP